MTTTEATQAATVAANGAFAAVEAPSVAMASPCAFVATVARRRHDLNAPLANIRGFAEMLNETITGEKLRRFVQVILSECDRALRNNNELVEEAALVAAMTANKEFHAEPAAGTIAPNLGGTAVLVQVSRVFGTEDVLLPFYESEQAAGMDLRAAVAEPRTLAPGERAAVPTGLRIALPPGYEAQIRPRSGLALRNGIAIVNAPGTIDSDFRGEIQIILINLGQDAFVVERGMRIAQMVVAPVVQIAWWETDTLDSTARGSGGFGSTGVV